MPITALIVTLIAIIGIASMGLRPDKRQKEALDALREINKRGPMPTECDYPPRFMPFTFRHDVGDLRSVRSLKDDLIEIAFNGAPDRPEGEVTRLNLNLPTARATAELLTAELRRRNRKPAARTPAGSDPIISRPPDQSHPPIRRASSPV